MAKATSCEVVTKIVTLELTEEEAQTIYDIGQYIGGSPKGRRGHVNSINKALVSAGVRRSYDEVRGDIILPYNGCAE